VIDKVLCEEAAAMDSTELSLELASRKALENHQWPGNIRQLRYAMRYACAIADGNVLHMDDFPPDLFSEPDLNRETLQKPVVYPTMDVAPDLGGELLSDFSDSEIQLRAKMIETLCRNKWQVKLSAEEMEMSRATFYRKLTRYGIVAPNKR
jgi:transcriptional regulator of acetoin/glycerol metabolism